MGAEQSIDHVRNTFIDIDTRRFDKEFVTDPRKCKSLPSTPLRTPRKSPSLPNLLKPSQSRGDALEENSETVFRDETSCKSGLVSRDDVSCKTADPMDDQVQLASLEAEDAFTGFQYVVPSQTLEEFLKETVPDSDLDWHVPACPMMEPFIPWAKEVPHSHADMQSVDMTPSTWHGSDLSPASWHESERSPQALWHDPEMSPMLWQEAEITPVHSPNKKRHASGPKDVRKHNSAKVDRSTWTCRMLRNVPNDYSRGDLCDMLDENNIRYDFAYLPIDWGKRANLGYAFVNLISHAEAERVEEVLGRFSNWKVASEKVCEVAWAKPEQQSVQLIIDSFKNNPVMHPDVPEEFKPLLFDEWKRPKEFPPPTKALRPPRGFLRKPVPERNGARISF